MIWLISDEHYFHRNVCKLSKRPFSSLEEMHEALISNFNKKVKPSDLTIHLGDFCFGSTGKYKEILEKLNGKHILILGNHDSVGMEAAMNAGFIFACTEMQIHVRGKKVLLKHYPYKPSFFRRIFPMKKPQQLTNIQNQQHPVTSSPTNRSGISSPINRNIPSASGINKIETNAKPILKPAQKSTIVKKTTPKPKPELDDVLKKLKEMGK